MDAGLDVGALLRHDHERCRRPGRLPAERRAARAGLRLPLIWPERFPEDVPAAMRAAHYASEQGRGAAFVLAAGRLAFCGGFDLDDPELLAEAAAAAGIDMQGWLSALTEMHRDGEIDAAGPPAGRGRRPAARHAGRRCAVLGRAPDRRGRGRGPASGGARRPGHGLTSPARMRASISSSGA